MNFVLKEIVAHGYLAVFILMTLESACIPIPSEAIMLFGGALSSTALVEGVAHSHVHLNVVVVALLGAGGNLAGSWIAYAVGRVGGHPLIERWGRFIGLRHHELERAEAWFAKRGEAAVLIGRVLPVIRTFISLPAGIAEMDLLRFSAFTLLGSLPWTFALAFSGAAVAPHWRGVVDAFQPIGDVVAALVVVGVVAIFVARRRSARPDAALS